jgi:DNA-binding SARP family transcriptional activator
MARRRRPDAVAWKVVDVAGSLLTALLVFGATPAVLVIVVGDPLAHGLGHQWGNGVRIALAIVVAVAWIAWAACGAQLGRAVVAQVRRGQVNLPAGAVLSDRIAARIAVGVLSLAALAAPLFVTSGASAAGRPGAPSGPGPTTQIVAATMEVSPPPTSPSPVAAAPASSASAAVYVVQPGDSLWTIAEAQLGDGADWPAIAAVNLGRVMPDGLHFVDPSRIYTGWPLLMPDQPDPAAAPSPAPVTPAAAAPAPAPAASVSPAPPDLGPALGRALEEPAAPVAHRTAGRSSGSSATVEGEGPGHVPLPELAALGVGTIACAALTRRVRRNRLLRDVASDDTPTTSAPPSPRAIDTGVLLTRGAGVPALRAFEAANCGLGLAWRREGGSVDAPRIRAICVGASGVDFWLAEPGQPAPAGFTLWADGAAWHRDHEPGQPEVTGSPLFPIVLPVGEDDDGTWLIPLVPGDRLPLVGDAAAALWRGSRAAQEAWAWSDTVLVTEDPRLVADEVRLHEASGPRPDDAPALLYFGDPGDLASPHLSHVAMVTLSPSPASDLIVLVDQRAASIHPLGRVVRPHLMTEAVATAVGELVAPPEPPVPVAMPPIGEPASSDPLSLLSGPGLVEVRLLTPAPRLDGQPGDLPPNRARRAVELVAYLALHRGDEVTSDRLRTRVLGSADADAASKTLFNIATAARRALGTDEAGLPLLPFGSKTGHYRISEAVTVDVYQAAELAAAGSAAADPEVAMGLLRAALNLVEGEPLSLALTGYSWWEVEGHGARIAAVLVNAAGNLAALAVEAGLYDLAHWGLSQARLLAPYSEALSRTAMQVSVAAGDADRLRQEWRECQRRIDELDPGATPSGRTEQLYGELSRQLLVSPNGATTRS